MHRAAKTPGGRRPRARPDTPARRRRRCRCESAAVPRPVRPCGQTSRGWSPPTCRARGSTSASDGRPPPTRAP
eukprot:9727878-Alexandrium_andersonii.AAC.1